MFSAALLLTLSVPLAETIPPDSLRAAARDARNAAVRYERSLISTAAERYHGFRSDRCDERIGRYCFWYGTPGSPRRPVEAEAPEVGLLREAAIYAFRRWFSMAPSAEGAVAPLLRYLIEADRPGEAAAAARAHVWAAGESAGALLLWGLALHYTGDFTASEAAFDRARSAAGESERRRLDDIGLLLESEDRTRYRRLPDDDRERLHDTFWAFADPWLMDPGNERRSAHYARHAWTRILALAPVVEGRRRWGRDDDEIILRYGRPVGRNRTYRQTASIHRELTLLEWFDPRRVALAPGSLLTDGIPYPPLPGVRAEIERDTARSQYAPHGLRRTRGLEVQPSVFPGRGYGVVRIAALLPPDTADPALPAHPRGLLVLMDTLGHVLARVPASPRVRSDSGIVLLAEHRLPPGTYVYRVEIKDDSARVGGLAQHRIDVSPTAGLTLSDLLVAKPGPARAPETRQDPVLEDVPGLVLPPAQDVAIYAEISGLAVEGAASRFDVQWWVESAESAGLLRRAARWLGETVGWLSPEQPMRVAWEDVGPDQTTAVFVTLGIGALDPGLHRIGLRVLDRVTGEEQASTRLVRIDPAAPPLERRAGS
jgi:hypothetical protein